MKAQFKYAFLAGLYFRAPVFAVIFVMNTVFIILGSLEMLPLAALITSVSLGGVAIAVMLAANIGGDVAIARRMFNTPEAYLHALTPVPRWKTLLAAVIAMAVMDLVTMVFVVAAHVWLSFNLAGGGLWQIVLDFLRENESYLVDGLWYILLGIASYFLLIMIIMFCVTAKKSIFYRMPASGLLSFLLACACFYVANLLLLVLAPLSEVHRVLFFIILSPTSRLAFPVVVVFTLLEAGALFVLTSKLLERKVNL